MFIVSGWESRRKMLSTLLFVRESKAICVYCFRVGEQKENAVDMLTKERNEHNQQIQEILDQQNLIKTERENILFAIQ